MTLFPCWGQCNAYALLHIYFCTQTMHYAFKGNLIHLAWFKTYFNWLFSLNTKTKTMDMVIKIMTREMLVFSTWKALQALLLSFFTLYPPSQTWYQDKHFSKNVAMAISFHMAHWLSMRLMWLQWYHSYRQRYYWWMLHPLSVLMSSIFIS